MKMGAEKKGEVIALVLLLLVAAVLLWENFGPSGAPAPAAATAPQTSAAAPAASPAQLAHLDPRLHMEALTALRDHTYSGNGRDLFHLGPAPPPPPSPAAIAAQHRAEAQQQMAKRDLGPPPPPPIPLTFYGFAQPQGQSEKIFLQFGDDTYVVVTGDVVAHRYQIEAIGKQSVRVKDLMTQSVQEVPLQRPGAS